MVHIEPVVDALPLVFSTDGHMSPADWVYFSLWLLVDSLNALMSINICRSIFKRHALTAERRKWQDSLAYEPVAVVVPCYLPNEKAIIHSTIDHICDKVEYPADVTLHLVYNSDRPLPQEEARLAALHGQVHGRLKRTVYVHHVAGSRSKAENLNHVIGSVLSEAEARYVAIFDADHHPDPACLRTLMAFMLQQEADCVQGSTYIRNSSWAAHAGRGGSFGVVGQLAAWLMANLIDAEFFVTYFVWMPAIELIGRTGFFGGSVALWRFHSLVNYTFSTEMQTEDIECSARAVLGRQKIRFCPDARSGELSPASLASFWRQRSRWATGWDQVSIKYFDAIAHSKLSCREKAGLYYVFPGRWMACSIGLVAGIVHPIIALVYSGSPWGPWLNCELLVGAAFYALSTTMMLTQLCWHQPPSSWPFVLAFYLTGPLYLVFQATLVSKSLLSILLNVQSGWVVTQRASVPGAEPPPLGSPAKPAALVSDLSPFLKPAARDDHEPALGFTLTRYFSPERNDSVGTLLDEAGTTIATSPNTSSDEERAALSAGRCALRGGAAVPASGRPPNGMAGFKRML